MKTSNFIEVINPRMKEYAAPFAYYPSRKRIYEDIKSGRASMYRSDIFQVEFFKDETGSGKIKLGSAYIFLLDKKVMIAMFNSIGRQLSMIKIFNFANEITKMFPEISGTREQTMKNLSKERRENLNIYMDKVRKGEII